MMPEMSRYIFSGNQEYYLFLILLSHFSLTWHLSCDSISHVKIEETCPITKSGRDY